jgi:hypothetical protein
VFSTICKAFIYPICHWVVLSHHNPHTNTQAKDINSSSLTFDAMKVFAKAVESGCMTMDQQSVVSLGSIESETQEKSTNEKTSSRLSCSTTLTRDRLETDEIETQSASHNFKQTPQTFAMPIKEEHINFTCIGEATMTEETQSQTAKLEETQDFNLDKFSASTQSSTPETPKGDDMIIDQAMDSLPALLHDAAAAAAATTGTTSTTTEPTHKFGDSMFQEMDSTRDNSPELEEHDEPEITGPFNGDYAEEDEWNYPFEYSEDQIEDENDGDYIEPDEEHNDEDLEDEHQTKEPKSSGKAVQMTQSIYSAPARQLTTQVLAKRSVMKKFHQFYTKSIGTSARATGTIEGAALPSLDINIKSTHQRHILFAIAKQAPKGTQTWVRKNEVLPLIDQMKSFKPNKNFKVLEFDRDAARQGLEAIWKFIGIKHLLYSHQMSGMVSLRALSCSYPMV